MNCNSQSIFAQDGGGCTAPPLVVANKYRTLRGRRTTRLDVWRYRRDLC